jgi:alpha-amylase
MTSLCFYFQVHQPTRLRHYTFFDIGESHTYPDDEQNQAILEKVANKCYLPANRLIHDLIRRYKGDFRLAYSISGVALDQFRRFHPEIIDSFKRLADTGCVEFLNETHYHSLAFVFSPQEFTEQVELHRRTISDLFGQQAVTFRNTELIYRNDLAAEVERLGYKVILAEGADHVLGSRSPNKVYRATGTRQLRVLLKNYRLSDDIAFRFSNREWAEYPLTAEKFSRWIHRIHKSAHAVNLFMDYETFGEHHWAETGIFDFLKLIPEGILSNPGFRFQTPAEAAAEYTPSGTLTVPEFMSWADTERDLSAWLGNQMQQDAAQALYALESRIKASHDPELLHNWRLLQTSDHFYYMCTKWFEDGNVHKYFNPYPSPYDAYINFMNILSDLTERIG